MNPTVYECSECGELIYSRYPGHWRACSCGSYVDQTNHYIRLGGETLNEVGLLSEFTYKPNEEELAELWENDVKFKALDKMGARVTGVHSLDRDSDELTIEVRVGRDKRSRQYLVWWEELEERYGE